MTNEKLIAKIEALFVYQCDCRCVDSISLDDVIDIIRNHTEAEPVQGDEELREKILAVLRHEFAERSYSELVYLTGTLVNAVRPYIATGQREE